MKEYNKRYSVKKMARVLGISRSGYYAWVLKAPSKREKEDIELSKMIAKIFEDHYGRYGSPRVFEEMKACGRRIGRKRVARLMRGRDYSQENAGNISKQPNQAIRLHLRKIS